MDEWNRIIRIINIEDWGIFFSTLSNNNNGMKKTVNKDVWLIKMIRSKN